MRQLVHASEEAKEAALKSAIINGVKYSVQVLLFSKSTLPHGALLHAVQAGSVPIVVNLLQHGANPDEMVGSHTPLLKATILGNVPIALRLLPLADVNIASRKGFTALYLALRNRHLALAWQLVAFGARVGNSRRLHEMYNYAAGKGNDLHVVRVLLAANAEKRCSALIPAVRFQRLRILCAVLCAGADPNRKHKQGCSALMKCAEYGHVDAMNLLLDAGADVNARDDNDLTALDTAILARNCAAAERLIEQGATFNPSICSGEELIWATRSGSLILVKLMVAAEIDVNFVDVHGETALVHAVRGGRDDLVMNLTIAGANLNVAGEEGESLLLIAALANDGHMTSLLVELGANIDWCDKFGDTALIAAARKGNDSAVRALLMAPASADMLPNVQHVDLVQLKCEALSGAATPEREGRSTVLDSEELTKKVAFVNQTTLF